MTMQARLADLGDAGAIAEIYNQGIEDRIAMFETPGLAFACASGLCVGSYRVEYN
jgi:hypothetical protein